MLKIFKALLLFLLLLNVAAAQDQKPAYWNDIQKFKQQDSIAFPGTGKILFVGSSSFTKWTDVQNYFPGYPIINRGFGGSAIVDMIRYESDIIFPYKPRQVVIYCGENDIAGDTTVTGKIVFERFKKLYWDIRKNLPNVPIVYISMKPSPSRWNMRNRTMEGNRLIEKFLKKKKRNAGFVNVWDAMLGPDGQPMQEIFIQDSLHMNAKGYVIWQKIIQPYLIKN
ncbi:MAG: GDSL-type esterase/lipase family protein [Ferruginibacter sp.]